MSNRKQHDYNGAVAVCYGGGGLGSLYSIRMTFGIDSFYCCGVLKSFS